MSRKDKKEMQKEIDRLSKLSKRELHAHMMIKNPDNQFMRKLTLEGPQGLHELQRHDLWRSIVAKKQNHQNTNDFLNSLTDDEFSEFVQARDIPIDKLNDTGRASEVIDLNHLPDSQIDMREQLMVEKAMKDQLEQHQNELRME